MDVTIVTQKDLRPSPTYQVNPDMRFATTFISNKYRDYAVKGETLMDKATGEIFTKRPEDGRVVSFFQNKKYISELMLDLRVMLTNNVSFTYPNVEDLNACYLSTDYDMMSLYENRDLNIIETDQIIPNTEEDVTKLKFNLSRKSNGFFCRMTSRDSDKAVIEWLTNQYNAICKNYTGTDSDFLAEKEKFSSIENWEDSNATLNYDLSITTNGNTITHSLQEHIRINEDSCVLFPQSLTRSVLESASVITVTIKSIIYDKIHFMFNHKDDLGNSFADGLSKFIYPDNSIFIRYCNICSFVDDSTDIYLLGNEFIIALMDISYVRRYMLKMGSLITESTFLVSPTRPGDESWMVNGIWAEQVRNVYKGGYEINLDSETDIHQLEMYLASNDDTDYLNFSVTQNDKDIFVE